MLKTKKAVKRWLNIYGIENYFINDDLTVDVYGSVDLDDKIKVPLPIKFNIVYGDFDFKFNNNVTLEGCPNAVCGYFDCYCCNLTSLYGAPQYIGDDFYCNNNDLRTLYGAPEYIGGDFFYNNNNNLDDKAIEKIYYAYDENNNLISTKQYYCKNEDICLYYHNLFNLNNAPSIRCIKNIIKSYPILIHIVTTEDLLKLI